MTEPKLNSNVLEKLSQTGHIIYAQGSLYTSVIPSLILQGVGEGIASRNGRKILILNGCQDRETFGMTACDFVNSVSSALTRYGQYRKPVNAFVNTIIVPSFSFQSCQQERSAAIPLFDPILIDESLLKQLGIQVVKVTAHFDQSAKCLSYDDQELVKTIIQLTHTPLPFKSSHESHESHESYESHESQP